METSACRGLSVCEASSGTTAIKEGRRVKKFKSVAALFLVLNVTSMMLIISYNFLTYDYNISVSVG